MLRLHARTRITLGLVLLLVSVLMLAIPLGLVPDRRGAVVRGRATLCETLAIAGSAMIRKSDFDQLEAMLKEVGRRNDEIRSIGVRQVDGDLRTSIGPHQSSWIDDADMPLDRQMVVPLFDKEKKQWGTVEVSFTPVAAASILPQLAHPVTQLVLFVVSACYLVFSLFLWRVLEQLNPAKAVPPRVRSTLETFSSGLIVLDAQGRIALANKSFADAVGKKTDGLQGLPISRFAWAVPSDGQDESNERNEVSQRGQVGEPEKPFPWASVLNDGADRASGLVKLQLAAELERTFMVNSSPVLGQTDGEVRGVLVSFDDITDLETTKAELAVSKKTAEEANQAKSEFLARMSHEIRTPMNSVLGFADVLRRGFATDEQEQKQYLNIIHSSGQHLLELINDILDLSKVESGKLQLELMRHSPLDIVGDVLSVLHMRAAEKHIALDHELGTPIPETILTDPVRLRQVLMNLVGNSIKFTEQGRVRVRTEFGEQSGVPVLLLHVIDTGVGIPDDRLEAIFDPFSQADTSVTRKFGGTGLGLAICRKLARAMGGDVSARSELGRGSVFTITVETGPLAGIPLVHPGEETIRQTKQHTELESLAPGLRVLVADDGDTNRRLLRLVLERAGALVDEAEDGDVAARMALDSAYDVILMDMQMPVLDGFGATQRLRDAGYDAPIIALTADAMKGVEKRCMEAGCSSFLTKPVDLDELLRTLASLPASTADKPESPRPATGDKRHSERAPRRPLRPQSPRRANRVTVDAADAGQMQPGGLPDQESPLQSTLPLDDREFCEIVNDFVDRLHEKVSLMHEAWEELNLEDLAKLAHWLKGSGGTAGFTAFTEPARTLEQLAKQQQTGEIDAALSRIDGLTSRVQRPETDENGAIGTLAAVTV